MCYTIKSYAPWDKKGIKLKRNINGIKKLLAALLAASSIFTGGCSALMGNTYTSRAKDYDFSAMTMVQLEEPEEGRLAAVIHTTLGDMTAVLYPEYAPNTVDNFVNRSKDGYYDNTKIYAVYETRFAATGSAANDGSTGASNDGQLIENEYTPNLWPFKGALCSYSTTAGYGDSRYIICNTFDFTEEDIETLKSVQKDGKQLFPQELIDAWVEHGSLPTLSGMQTVFGQIVEGMEVMEKIMSAEVDEKTAVPKEDIFVKHIDIIEYHKNS